jgi:hypothetical protein
MGEVPLYTESLPKPTVWRRGNTLEGADSTICPPPTQRATGEVAYRGTSRMRNAHHPRTTVGLYAQPYCRVLGGVGFS